MKRYFIIMLALMLFGCNSNISDKYEANLPSAIQNPQTVTQLGKGKELLEKYCYSCHQLNASMGDRMAPPMFMVKNHYLDLGDTKEEFTNAILAWVEDPSEERSKMPGALRKFGVMPYQAFPKDTIIQIAHYLYDTEIEKPRGFKSHQRGKQGRRH